MKTEYSLIFCSNTSQAPLHTLAVIRLMPVPTSVVQNFAAFTMVCVMMVELPNFHGINNVDDHRGNDTDNEFERGKFH